MESGNIHCRFVSNCSNRITEVSRVNLMRRRNRSNTFALKVNPSRLRRRTKQKLMKGGKR